MTGEGSLDLCRNPGAQFQDFLQAGLLQKRCKQPASQSPGETKITGQCRGTAIKTAVELSARYINDRKLPDKAIDVIDEAGAAQHLVAESKRRKTIGAKEIEAVVAKIARIPPKNVSKDDAELLKDLEVSLKRDAKMTMLGGQDASPSLIAI